MRQKELTDGIELQNKDGTESYGKSAIAGQQAIKQTAISRVMLPIPVLFFPAVGNYMLVKMRLMPKSTTAQKLIELTLCILSLTVALPMSVALFEQQSHLNRLDLEEQFHNVEREIKQESATLETTVNLDKQVVDP